MLKVMPRQVEVAASPLESSFCTDASSSFIRPTTRKRMSFFSRLASSRFKYSFRSDIRVTISKRGRFQFSTEKARSEERRVGKECRSGGSREHGTENRAR